MTVGEYIKTRREECGLTQESLARACGVTMMTIWKLESGKTKAPTVDTLSKIADALGVSLESLMSTKKDI